MDIVRTLTEQKPVLEAVHFGIVFRVTAEDEDDGVDV